MRSIRKPPIWVRLELAQNIYKNGEVEVSPEQAESIKKYVSTGFVAFVQVAVNEALSVE